MDRLYWVIIVSLILPWVGLIWLWLKAPQETTILFPFAAMLGFIFSVLGAQFEFYILLPRYTASTFPAVFPDLGLYPVAAVAAVFVVRYWNRAPALVIPAMAAFLTLAEAVAWFIHWVDYNHGCNFIFTYISYLIPVWLTYGYYQWLLALGVLEHRWEFSRRRFR